ncbi:hypothetical protein J3R73_003646 [Labrys monachus]|uniref:Uncharacterized protein n=1 Tax=Labrys monachus TaxID=217067 RepID=A0ABU0FIA4_9HYPH|nr:hypothetical protein [Labrys monachus]
MVREAKHLEAGIGQICIAFLVVPRLSFETVLVAVDFDNETRAQMDKICDIGTDRHLTPKMTTVFR